jgi:3-carboxy-cis,cis-muconate cycloisomerase
VLAAATRMPALVAAFLSGMIQEHERSVGGWQAEWPTIAAAVQATGAAAAASAAVAEGLSVDPGRMRANLDATHGTVLAERAMLLLAPHIGRAAAQTLVTRAVRETRETGTVLGAVLRSMPEVSRALPADVIHGIDDPHQYLGQAERIRRELLGDTTE